MLAKLAILSILSLLATSGCARVAAHQREQLSRRAMNPERDPIEDKLDTHVAEYREGSVGGTGVGGGGCGCN